jgi:hypothetical protein
VQRIQNKFGKDKFAVLLLDVDAEYKEFIKNPKASVREAMRGAGVAWPAVIAPTGWKEVNKTWKVDGYQLILIDQKGYIVDTDMRTDRLEVALHKLFKT